MAIFSNSTNRLSEFLRYIAQKSSLGVERIPALTVLSKELQVSVASLREQLEVARVLGFVEVKPKTGIRWLPYTFTPSLLLSVTYAISISSDFFEQFRDMRNHLEGAYFLESVAKLTKNDIDYLHIIVSRAEEKIISLPPKLPHAEHREFHATIFSRVQNPFVQSIFSVYWDVYEYQGYAIINDLDYLKRVWHFHRLVYEGIQSGNIHNAMEAFLEHKNLMIKNIKSIPSQAFE
ncbi:MAG: FadR family transcriptional regulator [Anaerolineaceae bacterium]|nr:FadR family transcriptional regulator [Anaerolineaceae bacterium]